VIGDAQRQLVEQTKSGISDEKVAAAVKDYPLAEAECNLMLTIVW